MPLPIETKQCARCKESKPFSAFSRDSRYTSRLTSYCKPCNSLASMEYARRNREKVAARQREWQAKNAEYVVAQRRQRNLALKTEIMMAYGGTHCQCCGETEIAFLAIDHIEDDGAAKRRNGERSGVRLYRDLKNLGFPPGFQVLCFNCNWAKSNIYGGCPHRRSVLNA